MAGVDDLYTFEPCHISSVPSFDEPAPVSTPKMGRRAVKPTGDEVEKDKKAQEAAYEARLAEKRAGRAGSVNEAEKFKQEAVFKAKLAEKRVSRGKLPSPMSQHGPLSTLSSQSPRWDFTSGAGQVIQDAADKGETNSYLATYERVLQESSFEDRLEQKRKSISGIKSPPMPTPAPHGDTLDELKARICLTESRGASPELTVSPKHPVKKPDYEPWQNPSRGIR
eukprot:TRINITY_DN35149_c0_g1_i1.p1 TRINITY_DN35149_c0_g1~~TRINITY_DN35149_c0_g1_i1.p1  ORF type:complete len:238 (+),score=28.64 TRINITY_DN35149_c0_g1_i1:44-715(+)